MLLGVVLVWAGGVLTPLAGCGGLGPKLETSRLLSVKYAICPFPSVLEHALWSVLGSLLLLVMLRGPRGPVPDPPPP